MKTLSIKNLKQKIKLIEQDIETQSKKAQKYSSLFKKKIDVPVVLGGGLSGFLIGYCFFGKPKTRRYLQRHLKKWVTIKLLLNMLSGLILSSTLLQNQPRDSSLRSE